MPEVQNTYEHIPQQPTPEVKKADFTQENLPTTKEAFALKATEIAENPQSKADVESVATVQKAFMEKRLTGQIGTEFEQVKQEALEQAMHEYKQMYA